MAISGQNGWEANTEGCRAGCVKPRDESLRTRTEQLSCQVGEAVVVLCNGRGALGRKYDRVLRRRWSKRSWLRQTVGNPGNKSMQRSSWYSIERLREFPERDHFGVDVLFRGAAAHLVEGVQDRPGSAF